MLHRVLRVVRVGELHVAEAAPQVLVHVVFRKVHVLDRAVRAEDLHDVLLVDGPREAADVDLGGARGGGAAPPLAAVGTRTRARLGAGVVLVVFDRGFAVVLFLVFDFFFVFFFYFLVFVFFFVLWVFFFLFALLAAADRLAGGAGAAFGAAALLVAAGARGVGRGTAGTGTAART